MRNFISEDNIEQAILSKLKEEPLKYDILICDPSPDKRDVLPDGTGRNSKKECVLPDVMLSSLKRVNPTIGEDKIKEIVKTLRQDYTGTDIVDTNYKLYRQIRNNIKITVRRNGKEDFDFVKLIDFEHPKNNTFTAVSQMWIQGKVYYRRPDILIFVNGMPLVFIELKNSIVKVEEAYNKNLKDYMRDIPNLFAFNQICVLSNGLETKLGAFNATYDYFFEWLKIDSEKEKLDREAILAADNVKDSSVRLQLVFVCAMWLTGFDVKNLSTLYLDKPMKGHTLMQAIARANRVYPGKPAGIIVDYVNVFKYMKKALTEYATGDDGTEFPAKDIDQLISYIDGTIDEADSFLLSLDIDLKKIVADSNTLDRLDALRSAYDTIVAKDGDKEKFKVILNTLTNLYEASKPEIFEKNWSNDKFAPLVYLHGLFYHTIDDEKVARARQKMSQILDGSVTARQDFVNYVSEEPTQYMIKGTKAIDLSKVDVEQLRKEIKVAKYKAIEINDLKEYIEQALEKMLNRNCTRTKFSERFKRIIDSYNAGGTENEDYYEQLVKLLEELRQEDNRANTEGLTEEELEIYDLLIAGKKLTQGEEQKVKLSAKNLYKKLVDNRSSLLVVDWYKDEQPRAKLKYEVELSLNDDLPESYDKAAFDSKVSLLMNHFVDMAVQGYGWIGAA